MSRKKKKVAQKEQPSKERRPRGGGKAAGFGDENLVWHVGIMDIGGPWGWAKVDAQTFWERIYPSMASFETMKWKNIPGPRHHFIPKINIISQAQRRLQEIKQDDIEELFSFALTGKERLWGIIDRNIYKILWWDPEHAICPASKKHT